MPFLASPRLAPPIPALPCLASPVLYRVSWVSFGQTLTEKGGRRFASGPFCPCGQAPDARVSSSGRRRRLKSSGICYTPARAEIVRRGGPYDSQKRGPNRPTDLALPRLALPRLALPCLASPRLASPRLASPRLHRASWVSFPPPPCERGAGPTPKGAPDDFVWGGQDRTLFAKMGVFFFFRQFP